MAAGESGIYSPVRSGVEAGGRPLGADGLQTFGGVRALARYVKVEAVPSSGGSIVINEASVVVRALGAVAAHISGMGHAHRQAVVVTLRLAELPLAQVAAHIIDAASSKF